MQRLSPRPRCSLCRASRPCPYKDGTTQRRLRREEPSHRQGHNSTAGIRGFSHFNPLLLIQQQDQSPNTLSRDTPDTHTIYESRYHNVTLVTKQKEKKMWSRIKIHAASSIKTHSAFIPLSTRFWERPFLAAAASWLMQGLTVFLCVALVPVTEFQWNAVAALSSRAAKKVKRFTWFKIRCAIR